MQEQERGRVNIVRLKPLNEHHELLGKKEKGGLSYQSLGVQCFSSRDQIESI